MRSRALEVAGAVLITTGLAACRHAAAPVASAPPPSAPAVAPATAGASAETRTGTVDATASVPPSPSQRADDPFVTRVRPILERRCSPCHFTGGIMYGRLPFDNPDAVRSKPAPLLGRLKVPDEHHTVADWLQAPSP